jgi:hypothetical protein
LPTFIDSVTLPPIELLGTGTCFAGRARIEAVNRNPNHHANPLGSSRQGRKRCTRRAGNRVAQVFDPRVIQGIGDATGAITRKTARMRTRRRRHKPAPMRPTKERSGLKIATDRGEAATVAILTTGAD